MAAGGGFAEEMLREQTLLEATCGDLFDHIDDLLVDFSKEESAADVLLLDAPAPPGSPRIIDVGARTASNAAPPPAFFDGAPKVDGGGSCDDLDMAQLEWLSGLFDDASIPHEPAFPPIKSSANAVPMLLLPPEEDKLLDDAVFRSSSPISVLEHTASFNTNTAAAIAKTKTTSNVGSASSSSSSSSSSAPVSPRPDPPTVLVVPARARSKRSRASAFSGGRSVAVVEPPTILVPTPMMMHSAADDPESSSIAESNDPVPAPPAPKKKKKAKKPPAPAASDDDADYVEDAHQPQQGGGVVRRCTHCQIEKTPQWRAGPLGPKTLCNACGVRYKSGRLFPEYRPAASPTFVPSIHSNSHKKVVEMRQKAVRSGDPSCDLLQFIRRRD